MSTPAELPDPARPDAAADTSAEPVDVTADPEFWAAAARRRDRAISGTLAAALCLEALTVLFVPRAIARDGDTGLTGARLTILIVLAVALFVTAGLVRRRAGIVIGSALQVAVIATGVLAGAMYFLGILFAGVWGFVLWVRSEIIRASARAGLPGPPGGPGPGTA